MAKPPSSGGLGCEHAWKPVDRERRGYRLMKSETYTLFVASNRRGTVRRLTVPFYALHVFAVIAAVGGITVAAAVGSYSRMLWRVGNFNALRRKQENLQQQYQLLQKTVTDTDQRMSSLQSLANEVAMTYGFVHLRNSPFAISEAAIGPKGSFEHSVAEFNFLEKHVGSSANVSDTDLRLMPSMGLGELTFSPSLWPVIGPITASFGERMDPFSGEAAFHTGVDISAEYGTGVRAAADGVVVVAHEHAGYGRLVVVDHGFGVTTWYGHLSSFSVPTGTHVNRGYVIGYVGVSGRTTGPHLHYEVRINDSPVNPIGYLSFTDAAD